MKFYAPTFLLQDDLHTHFCEIYINPEFAVQRFCNHTHIKMAEKFSKGQGHFKIGHFEVLISNRLIFYILSMYSFDFTLQIDSRGRHLLNTILLIKWHFPWVPTYLAMNENLSGYNFDEKYDFCYCILLFLWHEIISCWNINLIFIVS